MARVACREGAVNGAFELRSADGRLRSSGAFAHGSKTGTFIFWTAGGARSAVIPYDHDARTGTVALWYTARRRETAKKLEAPFSAGVINGVVRSYHPDGALRSEATYEQGALVARRRSTRGAGRCPRPRRGYRWPATWTPMPRSWQASTPWSVAICHTASEEFGVSPCFG